MAAATHVFSGAGFPGNFNIGPAGSPGEEVSITRYFDCTAANLTTTNQVCVIPAGSLVTDVRVLPLSAVSTTSQYSFGDITSTTTFMTASVLTANTVRKATKCQYYSSADEVQFNVSAATDASSKFFVTVKLMQIPQTDVNSVV